MSSEPTDDNRQARVFAVVGATGQQGGATTRALLTAGARVRALVRDPQAAQAQAIQQQGAELVRADLDDPASLRAAFSSVDGVYAMTTSYAQRGTAGEIEQGKAMGDAALAAGVPHVVYSSVGGAERHTGIAHFESKRRVEDHLTSLGLSTTFVRPVFFMENFVRYFTPQTEAGTLVVRLPLPPGIPLQLIATDDIGSVAAAALLDPARVGPSIEIAGDERTGEQIAAVYGDQASLPARYEPIPLEALANDPDQQAMFAWFVKLPAYQADFAATKRLAPAVQDLATWLARHRPASGWGFQQAVPPQASGR
jgi:uncharacterized protein YbjT (DUF2867 family)